MSCPSGQCSDTGQQYNDLSPALSSIINQTYRSPREAVTQTQAITPTVSQVPVSSMTGPYASSAVAPITSLTQPMPLTTESLQYINGILRTQIGRKVTVSFLIGTNTLVDKTGTLLGVGANYIVLNEIETDDIVFCDFYTIKFVKVYY